MSTASLFTLVLGLQALWDASNVAFDQQVRRIDIEIRIQSRARIACPHCGAETQCVNDTQEKQWRHLNFSPYQAAGTSRQAASVLKRQQILFGTFRFLSTIKSAKDAPAIRMADSDGHLEKFSFSQVGL